MRAGKRSFDELSDRIQAEVAAVVPEVRRRIVQAGQWSRGVGGVGEGEGMCDVGRGGMCVFVYLFIWKNHQRAYTQWQAKSRMN